MWSVEILLYCLKLFFAAFLMRLNYNLFLNWGFFPPLLLNHRGCSFFVWIMNKSLSRSCCIATLHFRWTCKFSFLFLLRVNEQSEKDFSLSDAGNWITAQHIKQRKFRAAAAIKLCSHVPESRFFTDREWGDQMVENEELGHQEGERGDILLGPERGHPSKD